MTVRLSATQPFPCFFGWKAKTLLFRKVRRTVTVEPIGARGADARRPTVRVAGGPLPAPSASAPVRAPQRPRLLVTRAEARAPNSGAARAGSHCRGAPRAKARGEARQARAARAARGEAAGGIWDLRGEEASPQRPSEKAAPTVLGGAKSGNGARRQCRLPSRRHRAFSRRHGTRLVRDFRPLRVLRAVCSRCLRLPDRPTGRGRPRGRAD